MIHVSEEKDGKAAQADTTGLVECSELVFNPVCFKDTAMLNASLRLPLLSIDVYDVYTRGTSRIRLLDFKPALARYDVFWPASV